MPTFHIHIKGCVQGVGYRPMVYLRAREFGLQGWVCNASDGLHIEVNANESVARRFFQSCIDQKPSRAEVSDSQLLEVAHQTYSSFQIIESTDDQALDLAITPDFAICQKCRKELTEPSDKRYQYAFNTCTHCGPRYSILKRLPYDRPYTTMAGFDMCADCGQEYTNPLDRRYFSQTNSCGTCGVKLALLEPRGLVSTDQTWIIDRVKSALAEAQLVAVKGIGGYLLLCDATNEVAVRKLRSRKSRPYKPFAVMYPDIESVEATFEIQKDEKELLLGAISPIVLLKVRSSSALPIDKTGVAPHLDHVGVMLPYAPLLQLICTGFGNPLVATSANNSGLPIIYEDRQESAKTLFQYADLVLSHNREISIPADDSVVKFSPRSRQKLLYRRARGIAPGMLTIKSTFKACHLALGAEMKAAFALTCNGNVYSSQYLGNLDGYESQQTYEAVLKKFLGLTQARPQRVLVDRHPSYFTHQLGRELSMKWAVELASIQHHEAHFAAILGEHGLETKSESVMGVVWDGTGFGDDGQIWGGEFFEFGNRQIKRIGHIRYYKYLAGEKMATEPRLPALSLLGENLGVNLKSNFTDQEWSFYTKLLKQPGMETSSMGRVFDAVAFLIGFEGNNGYEGQAATYLEQLAQACFDQEFIREILPFSFELLDGQVSLETTFHELVQMATQDPGLAAARFHQTLVAIIRTMAIRNRHTHLAFSGGVFQNALLTDLIIQQLGSEFKLYFHQSLSPNDENIAFGQLIHHKISQAGEINRESIKTDLQCV